MAGDGRKKSVIDCAIPDHIEDIQVDRQKRDSSYVMAEPHEHSFYEIYYLIDGQCRLFLDGGIYYLAPGDMVVVRPGEIHRSLYEAGEVADRYGIYFSQEHIRTLAKGCGRAAFERIVATPHRSLPAPFRMEAEEILRQMLEENARRDAYSSVQKKSALYRLLILLGRCPDEGRTSREREPDESERAVLEAARYVFEHRMESVTLEQAAEAAHMSPTYFSKKFRRSTGFGFKEYLTTLRLREAADRLRNTDDTVTGIALACGFSDGNYFGDAFKKAKGVSPRQYRKAYRDGVKHH